MSHLRRCTASPIGGRAALGCALLVLGLAGCHHFPSAEEFIVPPPPPAAPSSVLFVPQTDHDFIWEQVVDVVDDVFKIQKEDRVRLVGDTLTEGHLETYPRGGSTLLEPLTSDMATPYEHLHSTLQSIRQKCFVRVSPALEQGGYQIEIIVNKELEDVGRPVTSTASQHDLRHDTGLKRITQPVNSPQITLGWLPHGRNVALEQKLLAEIGLRLGAPPLQVVAQ